MTLLGWFTTLVVASRMATASTPDLVSPAVAWGIILGFLALACASLWFLNRVTDDAVPRRQEMTETTRLAA